MTPEKKITKPKPGTKCVNTTDYDPAGLPRRCIMDAVFVIDGKELCRACAKAVMK